MSLAAPSTANGLVHFQIPDSGPVRSFLSLAPELRLEIYRYLLVTGVCIPLYSMSGRWHLLARERNRKDGSEGPWPEILATCSRINREGVPILYGENRFCQELDLRGKGDMLLIQPLSSPLSLANQRFITDIRIVCGNGSTPDGAFDANGELRILQDFPSLKHIRVHFFLGRQLQGVDTEHAWLRCMRSANRKLLPPRRLHCDLGISIADKDHQRWWCQSRRPDFSVHKKKRQHFEGLMETEGLFRDRQIAWDFVIHASSPLGPPGCAVHFTVGDGMVAGRDSDDGVARCWTILGDGRWEETVGSE